MGKRLWFIKTVFIFVFFSFNLFAEVREMSAYSKESFTTIEGVVKSIEVNYNESMQEDGLHLIVEVDEKEYTIHVVPEWFAIKEGYEFLVGEIVTISGSEFTKDNLPNIYASEITRKFSSLSTDEQKALSADILNSMDLNEIASKYGVSIEEVNNIKTRVDKYITLALSPEPLKVRDPDSGEGLWGGALATGNASEEAIDLMSTLYKMDSGWYLLGTTSEIYIQGYYNFVDSIWSFKNGNWVQNPINISNNSGFWVKK